jgi:tetratricopeptide (TPR) repeat protein
LQDYDEAKKWLVRYPESGKNETYVFQFLSEIYEQQQNFNKALFYAERILNKDSNDRKAYYRICSLHEKMGNNLVALERAEEGIRQITNFGELALFAGNLAFRLEKFGDAERYYSVARDNGLSAGIIGLENIRTLRMRNAR